MDQKQKLLEEIQADFQQLALIKKYLKEIPDGPDHFSEQLIEKINKYQVLLTPGTDEYEKSEMMKEFAVVLVIEYNNSRHDVHPNRKRLSIDLQRIQNILARAKPNQLKKNGFMVYYYALVVTTFVSVRLQKYELARKCAEEARVLYNVYQACNPETPTFPNEFEGINWTIDDAKQAFDKLKDHIGYTIWRSYRENEEQITCPVEHAVSAIKHQLHLAKVGCDATIALESIINMILTMINRNYFKQVNHTLAVVWAFSVKARQKLSPEKRHTLDHAQGAIAQLFAHWATKVWTVSLPSASSIPNIFFRNQVLLNNMNISCFEVNNDFFIAINDPKDEEYKQYLGQFPIEPAKDKTAMEKIAKKGIAWKERAKKMVKDLGHVNFKNMEEIFLYMKNFFNNK